MRVASSSAASVAIFASNGVSIATALPACSTVK